ncbi:MAG TPA: hypothetical protein VJP06_06650, partial [Thermoplasmata archaeon]|nr:hypothetical protein [Thermoplasmata archaeon]
MGRTFARFFVPGQTPAAVLNAAMAYAASTEMHAEPGPANQVMLTKGSIWVTGKRVLTVGVWDAQGGTNVQVEAYVEGLSELSADPKTFVGRLPRRDMWRIASGFVASL